MKYRRGSIIIQCITGFSQPVMPICLSYLLFIVVVLISYIMVYRNIEDRRKNQREWIKNKRDLQDLQTYGLGTGLIGRILAEKMLKDEDIILSEKMLKDDDIII
jgi:hypothetical protein